MATLTALTIILKLLEVIVAEVFFLLTRSWHFSGLEEIKRRGERMLF